MTFRNRLGAGAVVAGLAMVGVLAAPGQANAWWRGGYVGFGIAPVVVAPPVYAPPPVYVAPPPPVMVAPPPVAYYPRPPVWIRPHWRGGYWIPGHWG